MRLRLLLATLALLYCAASPALAAGGRTVLDAGLSAPASNVDAAGASAAVALPDGGAVLFGAPVRSSELIAAALRPNGSPDPGFGAGGVAHIRVAGGRFVLLQALRRPDGRLLAVGTLPAPTKYELPQLVLVGLTSTGALDRSFGRGGIAHPGIEGSCENCEPAALAPDGSIVVTGSTGAVSATIDYNPNAPDDFQWVVARLTSAGATSGEPVKEPGAFGYGAAVGADGRITVLGRQTGTAALARLLPSGTADPSFAGGGTVSLPANAFHLALADDGAATVLGTDHVARVAPDGTPAWSQPVANNVGFARLLGTPDGGALVYRSPTYESRSAADPALLINRFDSAGADTTTSVPIAFGGGLATVSRGSRHGVPLDPLAQNSFRAGQLVARPDGSYLLAGGVTVVQYTGEGAGRSAARFAAAAVTRDLALDTTWGPDAPPLSASVRLPAQHATSAIRLRGVTVRVTASQPGLALVRVRDVRGRVLAHATVPVYRAGTSTARIGLSATGTRVLRHGHRVRVRVATRVRDLLATTRNARTVSGMLR